ncbi:MAG: alanine racemase [Holosporaceae bacterium]|jgi:alanine racemase|nr:alanine racemase [Holosporaceae bacterium]
MDIQKCKVLEQVEPHVLAVVIIDLDNVAKNYAKLKGEIAQNVEVTAVVKANSYGFGAVPISRRLYQEGCRTFFVATIGEGKELRQHLAKDAQIIVLGGMLCNTEDILTECDLIPVLNNVYQSNLWINHARKLNKKLKAVLHIDTGIFRNGYSYREAIEDIVQAHDELDIMFVMSHLACADTPHHPLNGLQLERFHDVLKYFPNARGCLSATNGIFLGDKYWFDIVRPGKALYGFSIREDKIGYMIPVADLFARIVQINHLKAGDTIGYGATFTADQDMTTVTVGMGYADGFMRKFDGFGQGFLGGERIPAIGRISMDYMVFDATKVEKKHLKIGNWVALTNDTDYTLERWALELGTLPHEVACRFGPRVKKVYVGEV